MMIGCDDIKMALNNQEAFVNVRPNSSTVSSSIISFSARETVQALIKCDKINKNCSWFWRWLIDFSICFWEFCFLD